MNIGYLGPLRDHSGYGEASRHHVAALDAAGVTVCAQMVAYTHDQPDFGAVGPIVTRLLANDGDYKIKMLHATPDQFKRHMEPGKYHIGFMYWETDKVPEQFVDGLKLMDEVWTGSAANERAIRRGGYKGEVFIVPQSIQTDREIPDPYELPDFDGYLFYSIFEWTDRKNPEALLDAYWREFQGGENVGLLVKTYYKNFTFINKRMIVEEIASLKRRTGLEKFPPVFLYRELMDRRQVMRIHSTGNCFVSAHRGEGWGIPQVEAMLAGNPVISTGYGGVHEYLTSGENAFLTPYKMNPVRGMEHSAAWYSRDQNWADVNPIALRADLRNAFDNREKVAEIGKKGQEFVKNSLNLEVVGELMAGRLAEIEGRL